MKDLILKHLREKKKVVSGEYLSSVLGISRVSVWKHIKKLREHGYPIQSSAKGYLLEKKTDTLYPWEFGDRSDNIHYYKEVTSTMDVAIDKARAGAPPFSVIIGGRQKNGRGRLKRRWFSEPGGLFFTIILRPDIMLEQSAMINFAASLDLAYTLDDLYGINAGVKWPNDIMVMEKKICGILSQMESEGELVSFINIGVGLNVNNKPPEIETGATSISKILGRDVRRKRILMHFLDRFEKRFKNPCWDSVVDEWKHHAITINRRVKVLTISDRYDGLAVDVDNTGALVLELDDGSRKKVVYGDCFH